MNITNKVCESRPVIGVQTTRPADRKPIKFNSDQSQLPSACLPAAQNDASCVVK